MRENIDGFWQMDPTRCDNTNRLLAKKPHVFRLSGLIQP